MVPSTRWPGAGPPRSVTVPLLAVRWPLLPRHTRSRLFKSANPPSQLGKTREPCVLLLKFGEPPRGCTPHRFSATDELAGQDSRLSPNDRPIFDCATVAHSRLSTDEHMLAQRAASRNARLR